jgi:CheY-like chemotaxis protein
MIMANLLVVEDERSTAVLMSRVLKAAGHTVVTAVSGTEALVKAHSQRFDLAIMDMSLPGLTGWQVTRSLKADPATRAMPVIAVSAATTAADRDEAYAAGCAGYEAKPLDIPRLLQRVKELTGQ